MTSWWGLSGTLLKHPGQFSLLLMAEEKQPGQGEITALYKDPSLTRQLTGGAVTDPSRGFLAGCNMITMLFVPQGPCHSFCQKPPPSIKCHPSYNPLQSRATPKAKYAKGIQAVWAIYRGCRNPRSSPPAPH